MRAASICSMACGARTAARAPRSDSGCRSPTTRRRRLFQPLTPTHRNCFSMATDILIVDDEDDIREIVSGILSDEGHGTRLARNSDEALAAIEARRPQLVLLDIWLQGSRLDGLQLLEIIKQQHPNVPVVMISGH